MLNLEKVEKEIQERLEWDEHLQDCNLLLSEYLEPCQIGDHIQLAVLKSLIHNREVYLDLPKVLRPRVRILYRILR